MKFSTIRLFFKNLIDWLSDIGRDNLSWKTIKNKKVLVKTNETFKLKKKFFYSFLQPFPKIKVKAAACLHKFNPKGKYKNVFFSN